MAGEPLAPPPAPSSSAPPTTCAPRLPGGKAALRPRRALIQEPSKIHFPCAPCWRHGSGGYAAGPLGAGDGNLGPAHDLAIADAEHRRRSHARRVAAAVPAVRQDE